MAIRYLAIVGTPPANAERLSAQILTDTDLTKVRSSPLLTLFTDRANGAIVSPSGDVHVIGHLFTREDRPTRVGRLSEADALLICKTSGDHLVRKYWGGFCAFIEDSRRSRISIQRDPSGLMPCLYLKAHDATIVASDVETLLDAHLLPIDIDWQALLAQLSVIDFPYSRTELAGVTELLAAHQLTVTETLDARPCWSPWDYTMRACSQQEQPTRLLDIVNSTMLAWGGCFDRVLLGVSGGLDSSIVSSGLASSTCDLTAYTIATNEAGGDERAYAQVLTRSLGIQLRELFHDRSLIDFSISTAAHLPRPGGGAFGQSHILEQLALGSEFNTGAYFTGIGGDNVFCFMQSATPFLDRVITSGVNMGAIRTMFDICKLTDCSIWDVLAMAYRKYLRGNAYRWPVSNNRFLNPTSPVPSLGREHAWLDAPANSLPGKAVHIAMLARVQATLDSFPRKTCAPQIHPLLSQPIMEFCLQVPTWEWCAGGQNRSVARQAFSRCLPDEILFRRSKGSPDAFAFEALQANRNQISDILIGGQLDQNGLLDRRALESVLRPGAQLVAPDHVYLYAIAEAEAWVRTWQRRARTQRAGGPPN